MDLHLLDCFCSGRGGAAGIAFWPSCSVPSFATLGLNGCGNGSGAAPVAQTAAGTYNFTVTASSGNLLQAQTAYTLVVQ
jgi:hypothetical protein